MDGWTISHYSEQAGLETSVYDWPALSETAFISDWRTGQYAVVNWQGHGWTDGAARKVWSWDDGDGVPEGNEISWPYFITMYSNLDDDYPSIVTAVSCYVGCPEPAPGGNLGIDLLTDPSSGASVGVIASARSPYGALDWPNNPGGSYSIIYEFNRYMINESKKVGQALYDSKFYCNQNYGWDHYAEYLDMFTFNLYGDPSLVREGTEPAALCGDANRDGIINSADIVYLINYLFKNGPAPDPLSIGDVNSDEIINSADVVYLINYLFKSGPAPGYE